MQFSLENLAAIATLLGTIISAIALVESRAWLSFTSFSVMILAVCAVLYARRERVMRDAASTVIEGYSIDSLNMANLKRRLDRDYLIQDAEHVARIEGRDMRVTWTYSGYCRIQEASEFYFSVDSEGQGKFEGLECVGHDLQHDPDELRPIHPKLVSTEGISKKLSVPFLEPIKKDRPFRVGLRCLLKGCLTPGIGYYSSTLSFAQTTIQRCRVRLEFVGVAPDWVRVYKCSPGQKPKLVKSLSPSRVDSGVSEYSDLIENIGGQSARVYLFSRRSL